MSVYKSVLVLLCVVLTVSLVQSAEFVPVYMWSTSSKTSEKVPALHKISEDSFKDDVLEHLKEDPFVVIFAEQTLSPEDFAQRDQSGGLIFSNLWKLKKSSKVSYLPYVQSPIKTLKHLDEDVTELTVSRLRKISEIPDTNILIIDLNDAKEDEHRPNMLQRHDADISLIYGEILKKHKNVLAMYTGHHTSWVAPEDAFSSRNKRSLLAVEEEQQTFFSGPQFLLYLKSVTFRPDNTKNATQVALAFTAATEPNTITITGTGTNLTVKLSFTTANTSAGYWALSDVEANFNGTDYNNLTTSASSIYAPNAFSYHCGDQLFSFSNGDKTTAELYLSDFQVQLYFNGTNNETKFYDAYDCVGFTSVPIWSGIFVTTILLLIMTFGITMMMDIRTMDRFDDAKGKPITINAE